MSAVVATRDVDTVATGEPGLVDGQPLGDLPPQQDPAAAVDALPSERRAIPAAQRQSVEMADDSKWTPVPGLPLELRADPENATKPVEPSDGATSAPSDAPSDAPSVSASTSPAASPSASLTPSASASSDGSAGRAPTAAASPTATSAPSETSAPSASPSAGAPTSTPPGRGASVSVDLRRPTESRGRSMLLSFAAAADVARSAPAAASPLQARLSYGDFDEAYGGSWDERIQVVAYPACFAVTPELEECATGVPVDIKNDVEGETITFTTVDESIFDLPEDDGTSADDSFDPAPEGGATPGSGELNGESPTAAPSDANPTPLDGSGTASADPASSASYRSAVTTSAVSTSLGSISAVNAAALPVSSGGAVYSVNGSGGNYAATPLAPSMGWQVGTGSGEFTYGYDLTLPKALAGDTPGLSLNYSSGGVDAMSLVENGQADAAGLGWTLSTSYIARQFGSCADDGHSTKGDLCWTTKNNKLVDDFKIVLNGRSSRLVRIDDTKQFRLEQDPTWKVELLDGTAGQNGVNTNDDNNNEQFLVTDTDGTQYWFGRTSGSVQVVTVFGNDANEPCYGKASTTSGRSCLQAYQWNLQKVQDVHGNKIVYSYNKETNYYAKWGNTSNTAQYDRAALLSKIEYGYGNSIAHQVVNVNLGKRCTKELEGGICTNDDGPTNKPHLWPDVPTDLICTQNQTCLVGSPTFFSTQRYAGVVTNAVKGDGSSSTSRTVDTYEFTHTLPDPDGASNPDQPDLWLSRIYRTGEGGSDPDVSLPAVQFFATAALQNRVVATGSERTLKKFRIGTVRNEAGGQIDVTYGHDDNQECTPTYVNGRDRWDSTKECFAQKYADPDGTSDWEWFHKYVVTRISLGDAALGYKFGTAEDTDLGTLRVYDYEYRGTPAWRFNDSRHLPTSKETWNDWRGYGESLVHLRQARDDNAGVSAGTVSITRTVRFRGLNQTLASPGVTQSGTRIDTQEITNSSNEQLDQAWFAGQVAEVEKKTAGGNLIERTYTDLSTVDTAVDPNGINAKVIYPRYRLVRTPTDGGPAFLRETVTSVDAGSGGANNNFGVGVGTITAVETREMRSGLPDDYTTCARTSWSTNNATHVRRPRETTTWGQQCIATQNDATMLARQRRWYDGNTAAQITKGDLTASRVLLDANGSQFEGETYSYDGFGRVTSHTTGITEVAGTGNTTDTDYNPNGSDGDLLTQVTTTGPTGLETTQDLDNRRGLPYSITDANGNDTTLGHDALGRLTRVQLPSLAQAHSSWSSMTFDYLDSGTNPNRVVSSIRFGDANQGFRQSYDFYDGWGRLIESQTRTPDTTDKRIVSVTGYDEQGLPYAVAPGVPNQVTSSGLFSTPLNPNLESIDQWSQTTYDAVGRPTLVQDMTGSSSVRGTATTYHGDSTVITPPATSGAGPTKTLLDAGGQTTEIQLRDTTGAIVDKATYAYDNRKQLIEVTKTLGLDNPMTWSWDYDWLGRTVEAVDPDTGTTTTSYTETGASAEQDPTTTVAVTTGAGTAEAHRIATTSDALGRPTERRDLTAGGDTLLVSWDYDSTATGMTNGLGQLARTTVHDAFTDLGVAGDFITEITGYDLDGNPQAVKETYPGQLTGEATSGTVSKTTSYAHTWDGGLAQVTYPGVDSGNATMAATTLDYAWTTSGDPSSLTASLAETSGTTDYLLATYNYTNIGQVKKVNSGPGTNPSDANLKRAYSYETALGRLATIDVDTITGATTTDRLDLGYSYDKVDNPTTITRSTRTNPTGTAGDDELSASSSCFTYDALNRLLTAAESTQTGATAVSDCRATGSQVTRDYDYTYNYGTAGDRLREVTSQAGTNPGTATYTYPATGAQHQLASIAHPDTPGPTDTALLPATRTQQWNPRGHLETSTHDTGVDTYTYNHQDRLVSTALAGGPTVTNAYAADGIRLAALTEDGGDDTLTLYLPSGLEITATKTGSATTFTTETARRDHTDAGFALASQDGNNLTWLVADTQGSLRLTATAVDNTATPVVTAHHYTPYGDPLTDPVNTPGDKGYLGKTHDATGDIRLDHRSFNGRTGLFASPDPILIATEPLNFNPYGYSHFNPVTNTDPTGLCMGPACPATEYPDTRTGNGGGHGPSGPATSVSSAYSAVTSVFNFGQPAGGGAASSQEAGGIRGFFDGPLRLAGSWYDHVGSGITCLSHLGGSPSCGQQSESMREMSDAAIDSTIYLPVPPLAAGFSRLGSVLEKLGRRLRVSAGAGANAGARALPSSAEAARLIQGAKPTGSALKPDAWHRAAAFTTDDIAKNGTVFRTVGGDGVERLLVQMRGEVNGVAGRFEWIVDGGSLTHQMFVRGGTVNGIPIKP
ncbi:MAG: hypothetical protein KJ938_13275 [Actinobacteria bacterium]|nr:hypothetical protein [Actinomycetota bacterium]